MLYSCGLEPSAGAVYSHHLPCRGAAVLRAATASPATPEQHATSYFHMNNLLKTGTNTLTLCMGRLRRQEEGELTYSRKASRVSNGF
eukprot:scaffold20751_cov124-Isochrysis_galbana.AAC.2